jgi:hypothetical protein
MWQIADTLDLDPSVLSNIRLLSLEQFESDGGFSRHPQNQAIIITLNEISEEMYMNSLFVFISHRWLRGWSGAKGWDGQDHLDDVGGSKYQLCLKGLRFIKDHLANQMKNCYIWLDYSCINQDTDPAGELKLLEKIVQFADCIFTPLVNKDSPNPWRTKTIDNMF